MLNEGRLFSLQSQICINTLNLISISFSLKNVFSLFGIILPNIIQSIDIYITYKKTISYLTFLCVCLFTNKKSEHYVLTV